MAVNAVRLKRHLYLCRLLLVISQAVVVLRTSASHFSFEFVFFFLPLHYFCYHITVHSLVTLSFEESHLRKLRLVEEGYPQIIAKLWMKIQ